jgi:hypothetical protein
MVACKPRGNDLQHVKLSILGVSALGIFLAAINMSSTTMKHRALLPEAAAGAAPAIRAPRHVALRGTAEPDAQ